jgi:WD40 repeat protein
MHHNIMACKEKVMKQCFTILTHTYLYSFLLLALTAPLQGSHHATTKNESTVITAAELKKIFGERWTVREELIAKMFITQMPYELIKTIASYHAECHARFVGPAVLCTSLTNPGEKTPHASIHIKTIDKDTCLVAKGHIIIVRKIQKSDPSSFQINKEDQKLTAHAIISAMEMLNHDQVALGCHNGDIMVYNTKPLSYSYQLNTNDTSRQITSREMLKKRISALLFLADKNHLIAGDGYGKLVTWDLTTRRRLTENHAHTQGIRALVPFNGGIATASFEATIKIWNGNKNITTLKNHNLGITTLIVMPNGDLLSGSLDCSIKRWDHEKLNCSMSRKEESPIEALCLLTNTLFVAAGMENGTVIIFNPASAKEQPYSVKCSIGGRYPTVAALTELVDGRLLAGTKSGEVRIYE